MLPTPGYGVNTDDGNALCAQWCVTLPGLRCAPSGLLPPSSFRKRLRNPRWSHVVLH